MLQHASERLLSAQVPDIRHRYAGWWAAMTGSPVESLPWSRHELRALLDHPRGLRTLLERVRGPESAVRLYVGVLECADPHRAAHRVFVDDLAEALLMPPTLIRELSTAVDDGFGGAMRSVGGAKAHGAVASVSR